MPHLSSNSVPTNNTKNSLKVNLQSDLSQHGVSLIDGRSLLLPVVHDGVQRVQRGAASVLVDREVGIAATRQSFPVSLQIAEDLDGLLPRARRHELRGAVHAVARRGVLDVVDHRDVKHIRVEMRPRGHRREHAVLRVSPARCAHHAEGSHLHVVRAALGQREQLVVVPHEAVLVDDHRQRFVQRLRLQQATRHEVPAPAVHIYGRASLRGYWPSPS